MDDERPGAGGAREDGDDQGGGCSDDGRADAATDHDPGDTVLDDRHGVVDRIVGDLAVVLIGTREVEHRLPVTELPTGAGEGDVLRIGYRDGAPVAVRIEADLTRRRRARLTGRLAELRGDRGGKRWRRR